MGDDIYAFNADGSLTDGTFVNLWLRGCRSVDGATIDDAGVMGLLTNS